MIEDKSQRMKRLKEITAHYENTFSESDNRARIIEPLFRDCLGWTEADISRQARIPSSFIDYIFSIDGVRRFMLEVKGTGMYFRIPYSLSRRHYKIRGTISTDQTIMTAMEQAQKYCIETGVRYGAISNGHQFILFEAFKHGRPWRDGKCIVFRSLQDILKNFTLFHSILGKEAVRAGSLQEYISEEPKFFERTRIEEIVDEQLRRVPSELKKYLPPILLEPDTKTYTFSTEDYFILAFVDANVYEQIKKRERSGLHPFPGLIKPKKEVISEQHMFSLEKAKNTIVRSISVRTPLAFALGKDTTLILSDYKQRVESKVGYDEIVIELAYIISYGDEINRYNVYNFLEDLIAYSLKVWKSSHA